MELSLSNIRSIFNCFHVLSYQRHSTLLLFSSRFKLGDRVFVGNSPLEIFSTYILLTQHIFLFFSKVGMAANSLGRFLPTFSVARQFFLLVYTVVQVRSPHTLRIGFYAATQVVPTLYLLVAAFCNGLGTAGPYFSVSSMRSCSSEFSRRPNLIFVSSVCYPIIFEWIRGHAHVLGSQTPHISFQCRTDYPIYGGRESSKINTPGLQ